MPTLVNLFWGCEGLRGVKMGDIRIDGRTGPADAQQSPARVAARVFASQPNRLNLLRLLAATKTLHQKMANEPGNVQPLRELYDVTRQIRQTPKNLGDLTQKFDRFASASQRGLSQQVIRYIAHCRDTGRLADRAFLARFNGNQPHHLEAKRYLREVSSARQTFWLAQSIKRATSRQNAQVQQRAQRLSDAYEHTVQRQKRENEQTLDRVGESLKQAQKTQQFAQYTFLSAAATVARLKGQAAQGDARSLADVKKSMQRLENMDSIPGPPPRRSVFGGLLRFFTRNRR